MKSLEHIIREIREGKCECEKKKESLEHAIRKVTRKEYESSYAAKDSKPVEEDVGGLIGSGTGGEEKLHAEDGKKKKDVKEAIGTLGTDKYQGSEFKSIRSTTPHIKPPGPEHGHSQAPENAARQRTIAKEKQGINRVTEEETIKEARRGLFSAPSKVDMEKLNTTTKFAEPPSKSDFKLAPLEPKDAGELATKAVELGVTMVPAGRALSVAKEILKPTPAGAGENEFARQAAMKQMTTAKTKTPDQTKPVELPKIDIKAPEKVETKTPPKPEIKPELTTKTPTPPEPETKTANVPKVPVPPQTASREPSEPEKPKLAALAPSVPHDFAYDVKHRIAPKTQTHYARKHRVHEGSEERKEIENMPRKGDRKTIEYVGRKAAEPKTAKEKTSRLAIIKNVLDEAKKEAAAKKQTSFEDGKTKVFDYGKDVLIISPDQKRVNLDVEGEKIPKDYENK